MSTLWRYMSLPKFCSLLEREALFFSLVGDMVDRFEGFIYPPLNRSQGERLLEAEVLVRSRLRDCMRSSLISCWTESEYESSLLWTTYAGAQGIAIRTTFRDLEESICPTPELPVTFGQVVYVDYREEVRRLGAAPLFHKRIEYREEGEVRAVLPGPPLQDWNARNQADWPTFQLDPDVAQQRGRYIRVDLSKLVKEVILPPHSAPWIAQVVNWVISRSSIKPKVSRSAIEFYPRGSDW